MEFFTLWNLFLHWELEVVSNQTNFVNESVFIFLCLILDEISYVYVIENLHNNLMNKCLFIF